MTVTVTSVIPAKAGIHRAAGPGGAMDSRLRGNDEVFGSAASILSCLFPE